MVLGELYLRGEEWKFRAVGQGWDSGLAGLATDYGIDVADQADDPHAPDVPPADRQGEAETRPAVAAVEDVETSPLNGESVEPLVVMDVDEVTTQALDADTVEPVVVSSEPGAAQTRQRRAGVRTRKKCTTAATLPPLTLAVDLSCACGRSYARTPTSNRGPYF